MFFPNPRTIKPRTMQNFIQNPYPPPKSLEHEKIIKPKPTWENQPRKIIKPLTQKNHQTQKPPTQNMNFILHVFLQIKTNPLKINLSIKNPYPQTETTNNNQNNHYNHPHHQPQQPQITTKNPPPKVKPKLKQNLRPILKLKTAKQNPNSKSKTQTIHYHCHHHYHHQHPPLPNPYPQTPPQKKKKKKNQNRSIFWIPLVSIWTQIHTHKPTAIWIPLVPIWPTHSEPWPPKCHHSTRNHRFGERETEMMASKTMATHEHQWPHASPWWSESHLCRSESHLCWSEPTYVKPRPLKCHHSTRNHRFRERETEMGKKE